MPNSLIPFIAVCCLSREAMEVWDAAENIEFLSRRESLWNMLARKKQDGQS